MKDVTNHESGWHLGKRLSRYPVHVPPTTADESKVTDATNHESGWHLGKWLAAAVLALAACASPTLPLPPPDAPSDMLVDTALGEWTVKGPCLQGALVTVFNEATGEGSVVEDRDLDGFYEVRIKAQRCDPAWVQQTSGQDMSALTTFVVVEKVNGLPVDPQACK